MQKNLIRTICALIFLSAVSGAAAQAGDSVTVTIDGRVILGSGALPGTAVRLNPFNDGLRAYNTYLNADGTFQFKVNLAELELYEVQYGGYSKSIILTREEKNMGFEIDVKDGKPDQMYISNSYENAAHEIFRGYNVALRDTLKTLRASCAQNANACAAFWGPILAAHDLHLQQLAEQYPETFTAKVLVPMSEVPEINNQAPLMAQMQRHFFDAANFTDPQLFSTPDVAVKFMAYLDYIADTGRNARLAFISDMFLKTMGNIEARKRIALALYNIFTKTNREEYIKSMAEWTSAQPWANEQIPVIAARLKLAAKVLPGNHAPEVTGVDPDGKTKTLIEVAKNNKLTMVLFWESGCQHCRQAMPEFVRLYEKYHARGFNVFAASLDHNPDDWKKFIADNHMDWININLPETTTAYGDYFIQSTPSIALVDGHGIITHRFMDTKDLEEFIMQTIK